jgi:hypothetical protein
VRIAYLVLAHTRPAQLARLLLGLRDAESACYVHIDQSSDLDAFQRAISPEVEYTLAAPRVNVRWGGFSSVQATLNLLATALAAGRHDYYILLSGVDYPIQSSAALRLELSSTGSEYIDSWPMPAPELGKPLSRLEHYHIPAKRGETRLTRRVNALLRHLPAREWRRVLAAAQPLGGSQWWGLTHECVSFVLDYAERRTRFVRFFRYSHHPDEMFFQTIIGDSPFSANLRPSLTFADWSDRRSAHPLELDEADLPRLRASGLFFARKFDLEKSPRIFDLIDQELRAVRPSGCD